MSGADVATLAALAAGTTVIKNGVKGHVSMRPVVGGFLLGTALLTINIWSPEVATGLGTLVFVTALLINGAEVFGAVDKAALTNPTPTPATPTGSSTPATRDPRP